MTKTRAPRIVRAARPDGASEDTGLRLEGTPTPLPGDGERAAGSRGGTAPTFPAR